MDCSRRYLVSHRQLSGTNVGMGESGAVDVENKRVRAPIADGAALDPIRRPLRPPPAAGKLAFTISDSELPVTRSYNSQAPHSP